MTVRCFEAKGSSFEGLVEVHSEQDRHRTSASADEFKADGVSKTLLSYGGFMSHLECT